MINAPRGTKDVLPVESYKWQYVESIAHSIFSRYGYGEIRTPIFEATELYSRGVGETTDIVEKEMYTFQDRGGRSVTLRPEGTAGVVRAYVEHKLYTNPLTRLYYIGPFFRYERPQAGRFRQHYQIGAEAIGSIDPSLDAEVIGMAVHLFESLHMTGLEVRINSIGCPKCRPEYKTLLVTYFNQKQEELCVDCQGRLLRNPLRILDCKKESCKLIAEHAPPNTSHLCEECNRHFEAVRNYLRKMEISYVVATDLVRGLDYYTKTVFEVVSSSLGAQSTVGGGGRYDGLVELLGGPSKPAVGFATGLERIVMVMDSLGVNMPQTSRLELFIAALGEKALEWGVTASCSLRKDGLGVQIGTPGKSLSAQLKEGSALKANYALIVGDNELSSGSLILRDMNSGAQELVPLVRWREDIKNILESAFHAVVKKNSV